MDGTMSLTVTVNALYGHTICTFTCLYAHLLIIHSFICHVHSLFYLSCPFIYRLRPSIHSFILLFILFVIFISLYLQTTSIHPFILLFIHPFILFVIFISPYLQTTSIGVHVCCSFIKGLCRQSVMEKKHGWHDEVVQLLSEQLRIENFAFYFYMSAYQYFNSREVAMPTVANFFYKQYNDELAHAKGIIDYMNQMGYTPTFKPLSIDGISHESATHVFRLSLEYEQASYDHIIRLYRAADRNHDYALCQFLDAYVEEQVRSLKEFSDYLVNVQRCEKGFEMFTFDAHFRNIARRNGK